MEDIRFTDPLLQEKEENMGDFHRDTEQENNLTMLGSVATQQGKGLSLHLPQATNSLNDNVNGDLNSGSNDDSCWEEPLDRENLESNLMQLAPAASDIIKDQGCGEPSRKRKRSGSEVDSDSDSGGACSSNVWITLHQAEQLVENN